MNRNAAFALLDQAVVSVTGFLTGVFIARILGVEAFGAYVLANGTYLFINAIQQSLILSPVSVYGSRTEPSVPEYLHASRRLQFAFSVTTAVMFASLAYVLSKTSANPAIQAAFLLMSPLAFFVLSQEFSRQVLIARQKLRTLLIVDLAAKGSTLLLLATLAFLIPSLGSLPGVFSALIAGALFGSFIGWTRVRSFLSRAESPYDHWARNYHFGKWAVVSQLIVMATSQIPLYLLAFFAGTGDTGIFGAAVNLTGIFHVFLNGIANYYLPLGVRRAEADGLLGLQRFTRNLTIKFAAVIIPISVIGIVFAEQIVTLVYDEEFLAKGAIPYQVFFSVAIVLALIKPLDIALRIREQMRKRAIVSFLEFVFVGIASVPMLMTFGVAGGAAVAVAGRVVALSALLHYVRRSFQTRT